MTSAQSMQTGQHPARRNVFKRLALLPILLLVSCSTAPQPRETLVAPYATEQLWAVVPPINESGVSVVETERVADMIAQQVQETEGLNVLPVNRVLLALRRLGIDSVQTVGDAEALMTLLDVDGLILGSITAYDPYPPMTLGLAVQLYVRTSNNRTPPIDPVHLSRTTSGEVPPGHSSTFMPVAQAAGVFRANDQFTLESLQEFAATRHAKGDAYGPDVFLVRMDLFAQYVSHRLIRDMLDREQSRIIPVMTTQVEQ